MTLTEELLAQLRCPETRQPLTLADEKTLEKLRQSSAQPLEAALIREDGIRAYPIRNGFPILLLDAGMDLG